MASAAAILCSTMAAAQTAKPAEDTAVSGVDDIVVTAQRRNESLQRTPVSVTALTGAALQARAIASESDLQAAVPGLLVKQGWSSDQLNYAIRGQSIDAFTSSQPAVLPYFNDVPAALAVASSFYDLDSIQVLKGPQGTLFGRNVTGGAVLYTTARPTDTLGGYVTGQLGSDALRAVEGVVNVPIAGDRAAIRLSGSLTRRHGFTTNLVDGSRLGDVKRESGRASLLLKPTETIENILVVQHDRSGGTPTPAVLYSTVAGGPENLYTPAGLNSVGGPGAWNAFLAAHPAADAAGIIGFLQKQKDRGPFKASLNGATFNRARAWTVTNTTTFDLGDDTKIKNIFGYMKSRHHEIVDEDGTPYPLLQTDFDNRLKQVTDELQLLGTVADGQLDYVLGAFYLDQTVHAVESGDFFDFSPVIPGISQTYISKIGAKAFAGYAQGTYKLGSAVGLDGLSVTVGLRYTSDKETMSQLPGSALFNFPGTTTNAFARTDKKVSWNFGINEQVNDELLLYAVARRSFRSGGFNNFAAGFPGTAEIGGNGFDPEIANDVELGFKYANRGALPVRLNVAIYRQVIDDIQRALIVADPRTGAPAGFTANVPQAVVKGLEVDFMAKPATGLEVGGNFAYTDAKFTKNAATAFGQSLRYGPYPDTPKWSGNIYAQVSHEMPGTFGTLSLRGELYAQTKFFFGSLNNTIIPGTRVSGYKVANFRLGLDDIGASGFSLAAFVKNAFDKRYWGGGVPIGGNVGVNTTTPGAPRTWFVEARYKF